MYEAWWIVEAKHCMVHMPFQSEVAWAFSPRRGAARLIAQMWTADGRTYWATGIVLLNALPALLEQVLLKIALTKLVNRTGSSGELISQSKTLRSRMPRWSSSDGHNRS